MPNYELDVEIVSVGDQLYANFDGRYEFTDSEFDRVDISFPVAPDANQINVDFDGQMLLWQWDNYGVYSTDDVPDMPLIEFDGPAGQTAGVLRVQYRHRLIQRQDEFVYFCPLDFS